MNLNPGDSNKPQRPAFSKHRVAACVRGKNASISNCRAVVTAVKLVYITCVRAK